MLAAVSVQAAPDPARTHVVLQLCWDHQFQFAGYYSALWRGYYEEVGLDVEIRSAFTPEKQFISSTDSVASGAAQFGVGSANILQSIDKGTPLVLLAAIFQHSGVEFYMRRSEDSVTPESLARMRILRREGDLGEVEMMSMFRAEGVDTTALQLFPLRRDKPSAQSLAEGEIDAILGYNLTSPYLLDRKGIEYNKLRPAMYGIDFYGDSLFTNRDFAERNPEVTKAFLRATLRGWAYALSHSEEMIERIARSFTRRFPPFEDLIRFNRFQADGVKQLANYPHEDLGHINPERWRQMYTHLHQAGMVHNDLDLDRLIYDPVRWQVLADRTFHNTLYGTLGVTGGVALLIAFWAISLKKVVTRRTRELVRSNTLLKSEIAERVRIEGSLRESEERFRQLVENIQEIFWVQDAATGDILYLSPGYREIWGQERFGLYHAPETYMKCVVAEDRERVLRAVKNQNAMRELEVEYRIVLPGGEVRWLRDRLFPILDISGEVYRVAGISEDITKRMESDLKLKRSEERLRLLVDYMPVMIHAHDDEFNYLFWNKESERVTGFPASALVGEPKAMELLYPDPRYRNSVVRERHMSGQDYRNWEDEVACADGSKRIITWSNLSHQCAIPGWPTWEVGQDVTELKLAERALQESEARYRTITENMPLGVLLLDENLRVVAANAAIRRWFPHASFGDMPMCFSVMEKVDRCLDCPCAALEKDGKPQTVFKKLLVDGEARHFKVTACKIPNKEAAVEVFVVIYADITEDIALNERLQVAKKTELVATMGSGIAHEVSQPLNALKLWATGLIMRQEKDGVVPPETLLEQLGKIHHAADRIADIIEHMRMLIRKSDAIELESTDINEVVRRALSLFSAKMTVHGIVLDLDLDLTPPVVLANAIQLEQVLINLFTNAMDALDGCESKQKAIRITTRNGEGTTRIMVEDNGPGFGDAVDRVFDPFYTTKDVGVGMGLGLSLVQTIVNSLGGEIHASVSKELGGACMTVELNQANACCII
ncbi:MAG: ABC transporter substrate-binding protein [Desulfovibrionaceae bacterium]